MDRRTEQIAEWMLRASQVVVYGEHYVKIIGKPSVYGEWDNCGWERLVEIKWLPMVDMLAKRYGVEVTQDWRTRSRFDIMLEHLRTVRN